MTTITIDGKTIHVQEGTTILRAAQEAGIEIPTLCDHPELTPYGGCRLCLVEIEGFRTLQASCTYPVSNNMVIHTNNERVREARKFVLSLIFSERNHFCPFCQVSGGDCELQNAAYAEEMTHWPLQPNWKPFSVDASHPFIVLDNNRCILCRRCVRACDDLVGNHTLGLEERGAKTILIADFNTPLGNSSCISCGTCIQVCPTGALIDRQSAYRGQIAEVDSTQTICLQCSMGCGIKVLTRDNQIVRIEGDWNARINHGLLCKMGRFVPLEETRQRLTTPMVRKNGVLKAATWDDACRIISEKIKSIGELNKLSAAASSRLSIEDLNLFKNIFSDGLGSSMVTTIDEGQFTSESTAFASRYGGGFEGKLDALNETDCVVCVGIDLAKHHEVLGFMIKRRIPDLAKLIILDETNNTFEDIASVIINPGKGKLIDTLRHLGKQELLDEKLSSANEILMASSHSVIIYGRGLYDSYGQDGIGALVEFSGRIKSANIISPKGLANSHAASLLSLDTAFKPDPGSIVFLALADDNPSEKLLQKVEKASFLVVQASYQSKVTAAADVILPVKMWAETDGHFMNFDGKVQVAKKSLAAPDNVRSSEESLKSLASSLGITVSNEWKEIISSRPAAVSIHINQ